MAILKYDKESFLEAIEPGISALVIGSFKGRLIDKINNIITEVYNEMEAELPEIIETKIMKVFSAEMAGDKINVIVDLKSNKKD